MKKILVAALALFVVSLVFSSCGAHKGCEAYSKVEVQKKARV
jgi:hypothetical protein